VKVGDYEILRRVGAGAYGKVYLARKGDPDGFRTYYALKRLHIEHAGDPAFESYLLREARHGGLVNHQSLVRIHEVLRFGSEFVLVMDYVDGITLRDVLGPRKEMSEPIPRDVALEVGAEVLEALDYIHHLVDPEGRESGFVHRDVKPGNIMLTQAGGLRLMDFGVARGDDMEGATQTGELRGTIAYMAPEQAAGRSVGPAVDQFAAGLVLLEMLTATPAWGDPRGLGILGKVVDGDVSEGLVRISATDPVADVLMRMLQPDPDERFPTTGEAAAQLRKIRAEDATPPALRAFARSEIARSRGQEETDAVPAIPSWTDSERDDAGISGTWSGAEGEPLAPVESSDGSDPHGTLPLSAHSQARARELMAASGGQSKLAASGSHAASATVQPAAAAASAPDDGAQDWSERTLPYSAGTAAAMAARSQPGAPVPPPMASPPAPPPRPAGGIPGGPLPPQYSGLAAGMRGRKSDKLDVVGSPLLTLGAGMILLLLLAGVGWVAWSAQGHDITEERLDPLDAGPTRTTQPTPAPEPELPGAAAVAEMVIEEEDEEPGADDGVADGAPAVDAGEGDPAARDAAGVDGADVVAEPATAATAAEDPDGRVVQHERWEDREAEREADQLQPGAIIGEVRSRPRRDLERRPVDERRTQADQAAAAESSEGSTSPNAGAAEPAAEEPAPAGPGLRFVSARQQPLGVPLSLRVRADGFRATGVSVYYQWRSEGSSGRRKRALRSESDGSFALDLPASELRSDRLQVWFVAEPGGVAAGSSSNPIEVRVR